MGYHVLYPGRNYQRRNISNGKAIVRSISIMVLLLILFTAAIVPQSREILLDLCIPGDRKNTVAATDVLIDDMKQGREFEESFLVFCESVIYGTRT